jgi:hypothetical protein
MKIFIVIIIVFLSIQNFSFSGTIQGIVMEENQKPLHGASIVLNNGEILTFKATDKNGLFRIEDLSNGKYFLTVSDIGYIAYSDSIEIKGTNQFINLEIELKSAVMYIDTVTEIENYHRNLNKYSSGNVLEIILDSITVNKFRSSNTKVFSTFVNKTDTPIYVIRDIDCLRMVELIIINSDNELFQKNSNFIDCVGMKENPDSSDFIKISPYDSVNYPPVFLYFYDFSRYPPDNYKIKLLYKYQKPNFLPGVFGSPSHRDKYHSKRIYYYNMALRGKFMSKNFLEINNEQIVK